MRSPRYSGKRKKPKLLLVRRVAGLSMQPALRPGRLLLATGLFASVKPGQVVIVRHGDIEKVKRVQRVREGQIFVVGDNEKVSVDSRSFGWLPVESVIAKVIWPQL